MRAVVGQGYGGVRNFGLISLRPPLFFHWMTHEGSRPTLLQWIFSWSWASVIRQPIECGDKHKMLNNNSYWWWLRERSKYVYQDQIGEALLGRHHMDNQHSTLLSSIWIVTPLPLEVTSNSFQQAGLSDRHCVIETLRRLVNRFAFSLPSK